jgi:hypothetical protein
VGGSAHFPLRSFFPCTDAYFAAPNEASYGNHDSRLRALKVQYIVQLLCQTPFFAQIFQENVFNV